jgi:hypothetical protein
MGSRLTNQSVFDLGASIHELLERFCVHEPR